MKDQEKKLPKSQNWKTFKSKMKNYGYSLMLVTALWLTWCWSDDLNVKKAAEEYQEKIENVETKKENLKNKEEALKDAQEDLQKASQELIEAQKEASEAKKDVKTESNKL